jgi:ABC-type branched-subunit amino acid transport system ATPase component
MIEHDLPLLSSISDRMLALDLGEVIAEGTPEDVVHDPTVVASYLGTDSAAIARSGARSVNGDA